MKRKFLATKIQNTFGKLATFLLTPILSLPGMVPIYRQLPLGKVEVATSLARAVDVALLSEVSDDFLCSSTFVTAVADEDNDSIVLTAKTI